MKRLLIGSIMILAVATTVFAETHYRSNESRDNYRKYSRTHHSMRGDHCGRESYESRKTRIAIDEKNIEIRKELLNENPDWSKIEKLNNDIALEHSKCKTDMMKDRFERDNRR